MHGLCVHHADSRCKCHQAGARMPHGEQTVPVVNPKAFQPEVDPTVELFPLNQCPHRLFMKKKKKTFIIIAWNFVPSALENQSVLFSSFQPHCSWVTSSWEGFTCQTVLHPACVPLTFLAAFPHTRRKSAASLHLRREQVQSVPAENVQDAAAL